MSEFKASLTSEKILLWTDRTFAFLFTMVIAWLLLRLFDVIYETQILPWAKASTTMVDDLLMPFLKSAIRGAIFILTLIAALKSAGYDVGALVTGLGISGLAFAMGARGLLANLLGGIALFVKKPV